MLKALLSDEQKKASKLALKLASIPGLQAAVKRKSLTSKERGELSTLLSEAKKNQLSKTVKGESLADKEWDKLDKFLNKLSKAGTDEDDKDSDKVEF